MKTRALIVVAVAAALMIGGSAAVYAKNADAAENEERYRDTIKAAERAKGLPAGLLHRLLYWESRFNSKIITGEQPSPAGALGIAQFMPATAARFGIDPLDPASAIWAAAEYLRLLHKQFGSWKLAVAAYNAGEGNVTKYNGVPPFAETQKYVAFIVVDGGYA